MPPNLISQEKAIQNLVQSASTVQIDPSYRRMGLPDSLFYLAEGDSETLFRVFDDILREINKDVKYFTWDDVYQHINSWLAMKIYHREEYIELPMQQIIKEWQNISKTEAKKAILPIFGLQLYLEPFSVGPIRITTFEKALSKEWIDWMKDGEAVMGKIMAGDLPPHTVCFEYTTKGTNNYLADQSRIEAQTLLNILRYTLSRKTYLSKRPDIDIFSGENRKAYEQCFIIDKDENNFHPIQWDKGPRAPFILDQEWLDAANAEGLQTLSTIFNKPKPNDFERAILTAVYWYGNSRARNMSEHQLLNLCTSIESCFGTSAEDKITNMLAEGLALINGVTFEKKTRN